MNMDPALVRDTLGRLLADENAALGEFESLLDREYGALRERDIDALESLAETRQANVVRLLKIEDERRALCSLHGYSADLSGLSKLIVWCDPKRTLAKPYEECASRAKRCRDLNDRNGVLVGAQIKRVEGLLGALTGATDTAPRAYGPRTNSNPYSATGRVISAEA
jgi:flagellar biosynthesis/type III secretory pathway chaperone